MDMPAMTRRDLIKAGLISGAAALIIPQYLRPEQVLADILPDGDGGGVAGEPFPTSPLILNPFTDLLPIPKAMAPSPDPGGWKNRKRESAPPGKGPGQQSSDGTGTHQIWPSALVYNKAKLPDPVYYKIDLRVAEHRFTSQPVQPIDDNGNLVSAPSQGGSIGPLNLPGSSIYGFNGTFPGPRINAEYGKPCLVRFENWLDDSLGLDRNDFGSEEFLTHLHNGHTAPESDGNPHYRPGAYHPGEWCDNLYLNYPAGGDFKEKQSTLWFHDHRMEHTSSNVYKGMVGLYPIYDPENGRDMGDERKGYRLPGVRTNNADGSFDVDYDIPMAFYDCRLDDGVTPHMDFHNGKGELRPEWWGQTFFRHYPNHGFVGDVFTVNGTAYPTLHVKRRRHRLRFLDASIARLYKFVLMSSTNGPVAAKDTGRSGTKLQGQYQLPDGQQSMKFVQIASEGGLLPYPILRDSVEIWPAKRREMIVDFSKYMDGSPTTSGDVIYLTNVLQMTNGRKPNEAWITHDPETGLPLAQPYPDPEFDPGFQVPVLKIVIDGDAPDNSFDPLVYPTLTNGLRSCQLKLDPTTRLPLLAMRPTPTIPSSFKGVVERTFELQRSGKFGGETEWLINDLPFGPGHMTPLASPIKGAAELWTIKNGGGGWVHPMHIHQEEHHVISRNGVKSPKVTGIDYSRTYGLPPSPDPDPGDNSKEDVVGLAPGESVVIYRKFRTFTGPYVAHCHNLAHEDHAMMFGWEIV